MESNKKKGRFAARLNFFQSFTGLILKSIVCVHLILIASIIFGPRAFNWLSQNIERAFLSNIGRGYSTVVFFAVLIIFAVFIVHVLLGIRKFPSSWKQHQAIDDQTATVKHQDTYLWYIQLLTGFMMVFAAPVHFYTIFTHPSIDAYQSADRVVADNMWFVYLILLVCVVLHGNIGLYRLFMKWRWFQGDDAQRARKKRVKLQSLRNKLAMVFMFAGLVSLLIFVMIGLRNKYDESYHAARHQTHEQAAPPIEEDGGHDGAPAVREFEPAHDEAVDDSRDAQEGIQEEPVRADDLSHEAESVIESTIHEVLPDTEADHEPAASIEESKNPGGVPAVQDSEAAREDVINVLDDVQEKIPAEVREEAAGDDAKTHGVPLD